MRKFIYLTLSTLFFAFLAIACTPDATPQPRPEPAETSAEPTVEAQVGQAETPTPAPDTPPLVLHSRPEQGEEQPVDAPLELTFDQPMDRDSVEKAFAIEPGASVDGEFEWLDDQTVRFSLPDGFERNQRYRVRVVETAQSETGLTMLRPFELRFSSAGYLEVTNVQPADGATEIMADTVVTVLFNRPVVPLNAIEDADSLPDPLTFVPPVKGQGEWLNTSIYQFTPDDGFLPATDYTARVSQGLADALGSTALEDDFEWGFSTVSPAAIASLPGDGGIYVSPTPVISVTFNQPMDRDDVEANFSLIDEATERSIPGRFAWQEGGLVAPAVDPNDQSFYDYAYEEGDGPTEVGVETVTFTPDVTLDFEGVYRIDLPQGVLGRIAQAETQRAFSSRFTVTPYPNIVSTFPEDGEERADPWTSLEITFSAPMNPDSVEVGETLFIQPSVAVTEVFTYWWNSDTNLQLNFPTQASTGYEVTLSADVEGRYGQKLGSERTIAWQTRAQDPFLFMHTPGRLATYNAYTDTLTFVTVRNVSQVDFALYRLPAADFIRLNGNNWWESWENYRPVADNLISDWSLTTTPELNNNVIYRVDLGDKSGLGSSLPPGLYYLEATYGAEAVYEPALSSGFFETRERQMLVVSRTNLTLKTSGAEALAWATDLQSGQPLPDVPVRFYLDDGQKQVTADEDGVAVATYVRDTNNFLTRFAFVGDPDRPDENFAVAADQWADGIERYQFSNISTEDYQQPFNAHFYTDRGIYRPGQTVYFKGVIRADDDARYRL
ncbi:MAG: Ig-like domain-containing protein, partial [Anaerolineae bacterium]|nr:Ig-like domain-containing protein [Anaerolineae bacterium]